MKKLIALILSVSISFGTIRTISFAEEPIQIPKTAIVTDKENDPTDNVFADISLVSKAYGEAKNNKERLLLIESKIAELETKKSYLNKVKRGILDGDPEKLKEVRSKIQVLEFKIDWLKKLLHSTAKIQKQQRKIILSVITIISTLSFGTYLYATRNTSSSFYEKLKNLIKVFPLTIRSFSIRL